MTPKVCFLLLSVIFPQTALAPNVLGYDQRVSIAWNKMVEEAKLWTKLHDNLITVKRRSKMEKEEFEKLKTKWQAVVMEVESLE